jgi:hypothetical protein
MARAGKRLTMKQMKQMAAVDFKALKPALLYMPASPAEWAALYNPHGFTIATTSRGLQQTKAELVGTIDRLGLEAVDELMQQMCVSADYFRAMAEMIETFACRIVCAEATREERGTKAVRPRRLHLVHSADN